MIVPNPEVNPLISRLESVEKQLANCIELLLGNPVSEPGSPRLSKPPPFPQISPLQLPALGQSIKHPGPQYTPSKESEHSGDVDFPRSTEDPINLDEIDIESMLSLADESMDDIHFISDCQLLGTRDNFKLGRNAFNLIEDSKQGSEGPNKEMILNLLQDLSEKMRHLRAGVEENAQDLSPYLRKKSSARLNVPKPIMERKNSFVQ